MFKVKQLGIDGNIHNWIENSFSDRKQRVINGTTSDWAPVTTGVPQGSVLGPVQFIIFINDIDVGLNNFISKFANDTKIGKSIITDHDSMSLQEKNFRMVPKIGNAFYYQQMADITSRLKK